MVAVLVAVLVAATKMLFGCFLAIFIGGAGLVRDARCVCCGELVLIRPGRLGHMVAMQNLLLT